MGAGRKKKVVHDDDAPSIRSKKSRLRRKAKKDEVLAYERKESEKDITGSESNVTQEIRTVTRGITHMDRLVVQRGKGLKKDIRFNKNGVPIGSDAAEMKSYISVLALGKVNINYKSWKHVPKQIKELIWESVNLGYNVPPWWKRSCLMSANDRWRGFKTTITQDHVYANRDNLEKLKKPPADYDIKQEDWSSFVLSRMSTEFMRLSEQQKVRRKKIKHPHRLARNGYASLAEEIAHELCDDDEINRAILCKRARMNKKGEFDKKDKKLKEKMRRIDQYIDERKQGKLKITGPIDGIIPRALESKEATGRVMGIGGYVASTTYFNNPKGKTNPDFTLFIEQQKELMEIKKKRF